MKLITKFLMRLADLRRELVLAGSVLLIASSSGAMTVDRIAAKVGGEIITLSTVLERYQAEITRRRQSGDRDINEPEKALPIVLDSIIEEKLLTQQAKKIGITVPEKSVQDALDNIKLKNSLTDEQLDEMLQKENSSLERYKQTIRDQILVSKVRNYEVLSRINIPEGEVKKYYRVHQKEFWTPAKVHARHILFILDEKLTPEEVEIKRQKAENIHKQIKSGKDFEELAKLYSEDLSGSSGGDLGVLERGKMVAEFEEAVFSLKDGEISDVVKTPYGLHIIKADKVFPGNTIPYSDVKEKIKGFLAAEKGQDFYEKWIKELKANAYVEKLLFKDPPKQKKPIHKNVKKKKTRTVVKKNKAKTKDSKNTKVPGNDE